MSPATQTRPTVAGWPARRRTRRASAAALCLMLGLSAAIAHANSPVPPLHCPTLPVPPDTQQTVLASRIVNNGLPLMIVSARNRMSPRAFAAFYKRRWRTDNGKRLWVENRIGKFNVVAHKSGQCFYTVQIQRGVSATNALLGVGRPDDRQNVKSALDFPAPGDARPLTHMVSEDSGTLGNTWLLYTRNSPAATRGFYARTMAAHGWHTVLGNNSGATRDNAKAFMFDKGAKHAGVVVAPLKRGSAITITVMSR